MLAWFDQQLTGLGLQAWLEQEGEEAVCMRPRPNLHPGEERRGEERTGCCRLAVLVLRILIIRGVRNVVATYLAYVDVM